jgi:serine protease DegQ
MEMSQADGKGFLVGLSNDLADAVARAGQYVVRVNGRRRQPASGILWSQDGVVITADHVLEADEGITIGLPDGKEVAAQLAGRDQGTDLALLRVQATGLAGAEMADPAAVKVGNLVLAVGRPGAGDPMASIGIISAMTGPWRTWRGGMLERLIQTDVTLYPGFSGGALVDASGKVAGLNTSLLARGISAALPVDTLQRVAEAILTQGRVKRGYLGVSTQAVPIPAALSQGLGLSQKSGLLVVSVEAGGPAEKGGLMLGDLLVGLAGQTIEDTDDLQALLGGDRVGQATPVQVIRGGQSKEMDVTIGERR